MRSQQGIVCCTWQRNSGAMRGMVRRARVWGNQRRGTCVRQSRRRVPRIAPTGAGGLGIKGYKPWSAVRVRMDVDLLRAIE